VGWSTWLFLSLMMTGLLWGCGEGADQEVVETADPQPVPQEVLAIVQKGECLDCHVLDGQGIHEGPSLNRVGARLSAEQLRRKIVNPAAFPAQGYENLAGRMPTDFQERFTQEELALLVDHLASRR
jgi:mono/diheme cytochrome c family protein